VHDQLSKWTTKYSWDEGKHEFFFKIKQNKGPRHGMITKMVKVCNSKGGTHMTTKLNSHFES
jgi:hypothetical protein